MLSTSEKCIRIVLKCRFIWKKRCIKSDKNKKCYYQKTFAYSYYNYSNTTNKFLWYLSSFHPGIERVICIRMFLKSIRSCIRCTDSSNEIVNHLVQLFSLDRDHFFFNFTTYFSTDRNYYTYPMGMICWMHAEFLDCLQFWKS